jgi:hypothetical protein
VGNGSRQKKDALVPMRQLIEFPSLAILILVAVDALSFCPVRHKRFVELACWQQLTGVRPLLMLDGIFNARMSTQAPDKRDGAAVHRER